MEPLSEAHQSVEMIHRRDAVRRITGYFRILGLNDRPALAEAVRAVTRHAEHQGRADPKLLVIVALDEVDRWIDALACMSAPDIDMAQKRLGVLCRLKQALAVAPHAFLKTDNLPSSFLRIVHKSAPPVIAPPAPTQMEPTPFGKQMTIFRYEFWLWLFRRATAPFRKGGKSE